MTCATLSEAEALVANGITNILISSELAGQRKIQHYIDLSRQGDVIAVVDGPEGAAALAAAGRDQGCRLPVFVNVNVGQNRTGVQPGGPTVELARRVIAEGLWLRGLMGYEGHVAHKPEGPEKESAYDLALPHFDEAIRLRPQDADLRTNLGALLASRGDLPGAVRWFEEALKLNPNDKVAREYLARAQAALAGQR